MDFHQVHLRKAICKLRISAHNLLIESGKYSKKGSLTRENRICRFCNMNAIGNEFHFLINCSFYNAERSEFFCKINKFNVNYTYLNIINKARWVLLQENKEFLLALGTYLYHCIEKRDKVLNE